MDAPVASLDGIHKQNILKIFLPEAGSQVILFSNTEHIDTKEDYASLKPYIYNEITLIKPIVS
jgi:DNA sulfur modification protein DndD